jgi:Protein of unknown function (DUF4236)
MGWGFRRSINFGPLRINLSKSGMGYSVGTRGLRVGKDVNGRTYSSVSIPATGIYRRDYYRNKVSQAQSPLLPTSQPAPSAKPQLVRANPTAGILPPHLSLCVVGGVLLYVLVRALF